MLPSSLSFVVVVVVVIVIVVVIIAIVAVLVFAVVSVVVVADVADVVANASSSRVCRQLTTDYVISEIPAKRFLKVM